MKNMIHGLFFTIFFATAGTIPIIAKNITIDGIPSQFFLSNKSVKAILNASPTIKKILPTSIINWALNNVTLLKAEEFADYFINCSLDECRQLVTQTQILPNNLKNVVTNKECNPWKIQFLLEAHPSLIPEFAQYIAQTDVLPSVHFNIVEYVLTSFPQAYDAFINAVIHSKNEIDHRTLYLLIEYDKNHKQQLIVYILGNDELLKHSNVEDYAQSYPQHAAQLADTCFKEFLKDNMLRRSWKWLQKEYAKNSELRKHLQEKITQDCYEVPFSLRLESIDYLDPEFAWTQFLNFINNNAASIKHQRIWLQEFCRAIEFCRHKYKDRLSAYVAEILSLHILPDNEVYWLIREYPQKCLPELIRQIKNGTQISGRIIRKLCKYATDEQKQQLYNYAQKQQKITSSNQALQYILTSYQAVDEDKKDDIRFNAATQSHGHLKENIHQIIERFGEKLADDTQLINMLEHLLKKEQEEQTKGNYTFVHAQAWKWHLLADVFKMLWQMVYNEHIDDYQFLRFMQKPSAFGKLYANIQRLMMIKYGRTYHNRPDLLFMNHALFGNTGNGGSCSFGYFLRNHDMSDITITIKDLFAIFDVEELYPQFHEQFQQLSTMHASANDRGNMLLLSFTPEHITKCVYVAQPGGSKTMIDVYGEKTDNVITILETLKQNPHALEKSDVIEYCMTLTQDCALDPRNGPRIFAFNTADKNIMEQYAAARDTIFEELKKQPKPKISTFKKYVHDAKKIKATADTFFARAWKTIKNKNPQELLNVGTQVILAYSVAAGLGSVLTGDITPSMLKDATWWKAFACSTAWYKITQRIHASHNFSQDPYILAATLTLAPCGVYKIFKKIGW